MTARETDAPETPSSTIAAVIPARWASSRFPGKPLHLLASKPMIQHVWERCQRCSAIDKTIIATDDQRIASTARAFGANVTITREDHTTGTDRIAEVIEKHPEIDAVVNVQGDEPLIDPTLIDELANLLRDHPELQMATAATFINITTQEGKQHLQDPNVVKVVRNRAGDALYFSRSAIPYVRDAAHQGLVQPLRHKGIYAYTRKFLLEFVSWPPSTLEQSEQLEQLRALDQGVKIRVITTNDDSPGIDTPQQADAMESLLRQIYPS